MMQILSYWHFDAGSIILLSIVVLHFAVLNSLRHKGIFYFIVAVLLCVICFFSPLAVLSKNYLFSAHMVVHVILLLCVAPILLQCLSAASKSLSRFFKFINRQPMLAWVVGVGIMWLWHIPFLFNNAMENLHSRSFNFLSFIENISLLVSGIIFSAPVVHPDKRFRIDPLSGVVYLFTACIGCSLLGLLITFAPAATYHHFLLHDVYGLNNLIINDWNISQQSDQQSAGLIMWIPCCLIYVTGAMYLLMNWLTKKELVTVQLNKK